VTRVVAVLAGLRRRLDPYVVAMAAVVLLASVAPARGAGAVAAGWAADLAIAFLFLLYGARLSPGAAWRGLRQWRLHLAVLAGTYALFPLLGLAARSAAPGLLPAPLWAGVIFLCILPSTVQSSIAFTSIARGHVAAALCAASASNLLGVVLTPALAGLLLQAQGVGLSLGVLRDIALQLLAPFLLGQVLRPWAGPWVQAHGRVLGYADRGSILIVIYVAFSEGVRQGVWSRLSVGDLALLTLVCLVLLGVVLALTLLAARRGLRLDREDEIVLVFCGSKKSLASGLPMASVLFPPAQVGLIVLPLMLFHQIQLIVCADLARRYARRRETATSR